MPLIYPLIIVLYNTALANGFPNRKLRSLSHLVLFSDLHRGVVAAVVMVTLTSVVILSFVGLFLYRLVASLF